jgi:Ca2+-binding EF-hand superfamily protein
LLRQIFNGFDSNGDGYLTRNELVEGYVRLLGSEQKAEIEVDLIIRKL